ncbi:MAG: right-handed parallel beta-helix repeat-containing protein [bacterium]|nr:right-handed parallel beta-helix repeat-containing protein [bacterium]
MAIILMLFSCGALCAGAATHYVDAQNGAGAASPFTNWATAAVAIQDAVDVAGAGALILVNTGVYASGAQFTPGFALANRVLVTNALTLASVGGPAVTAIAGARDPGSALGLGSNAVRAVYLTSGAQLLGFTVSNGATFGKNEGEGLFERSGGGVFLADAVVSNCIVVGNAAENYGGGVFGSNGAAVYASQLSSNWCSGYGAGMAWPTNGILRDSLINGNVVSNYDGGGVHAAASGFISNCVISGNLSQKGSGGGVLVFRAGFEMVDCLLQGNRVVTGRGGGMFLNSWTQYRGVINNCRFEDNAISAGSQYGGGAYFTVGEVNNCLFTRNTGPAYGGAIASYATQLSNCTIVSNRSANQGGGVYLMVSSGLRNAIVYGNSTPVTNANWYCKTGDANITCAFVCTLPQIMGEGTITNDPQFVDADGGNYRLVSGSPCINAGSNAYAVGVFDLDATARIKQSIVDMGAYEAVPEPMLLGMLLLVAMCNVRSARF